MCEHDLYHVEDHVWHLSGAAATTAVDALDDATLLQLGFGHTADAVRSEVGVPRLDAAQAAEVLVSGLLPLGNQVAIGDLLL